jgi:hypothetical protein
VSSTPQPISTGASTERPPRSLHLDTALQHDAAHAAEHRRPGAQAADLAAQERNDGRVVGVDGGADERHQRVGRGEEPESLTGVRAHERPNLLAAEPGDRNSEGARRLVVDGDDVHVEADDVAQAERHRGELSPDALGAAGAVARHDDGDLHEGSMGLRPITA